MPLYTVEIHETNRLEIALEAASEEEAEKRAEEILLEQGDEEFEVTTAVARTVSAYIPS